MEITNKTVEHGVIASSTAEVVHITVKSPGIEFRLDGYFEDGGRVLLKYIGVWGIFCISEWKNMYTPILCRQFGYTGGTTSSIMRAESLPTWVGDIECADAVTSLSECTYNMVLSVRPCVNGEDVGVKCYTGKGPTTSKGCLDGSETCINKITSGCRPFQQYLFIVIPAVLIFMYVLM